MSHIPKIFLLGVDFRMERNFWAGAIEQGQLYFLVEILGLIHAGITFFSMQPKYSSNSCVIFLYINIYIA